MGMHAWPTSTHPRTPWLDLLASLFLFLHIPLTLSRCIVCIPLPTYQPPPTATTTVLLSWSYILFKESGFLGWEKYIISGRQGHKVADESVQTRQKVVTRPGQDCHGFCQGKTTVIVGA